MQTADRIGRVVRVQRPESLSGDTLSITDTYYDGVRPVQEVGWKGVPARVVTGTSPTGGSSTSTYKLPRRANELDDSLSENQRAAPWAARRLEREYLWAADPGGYVDECVAQLVYTSAHAVGTGEQAGMEVGNDTTPTILYTLNDHTSSVAGLTDAAGRMVCQYSYTPYGELRASEYFDIQTQGATSTEATEALAAARSNRLGHQGLFTVRFDRPWDGAMDMGTAVTSGTSATGPYRAVCHNRNRLYDPALGRFLENDPNGLGVPVLGELAYGGMAIGASGIEPDVQGHYGDGMNAHGAYRSVPQMARDASGLLIGTAVNLLLPTPFDYVTSVYTQLFEEYSARLDWDVEWSADWTTHDNWHSRLDDKWVTDAIGRGLYHAFDIGIPFTDTTINPLDPFGGGAIAGTYDGAQAGIGGFYQRTISKGGHVVASFARRVNIGGHYVLKFKPFRGGRDLVKFPEDIIKEKARVRVTNEVDEIAQANRKFGKPAHYTWIREYGEPHTWHHHWVTGEMQLVPTPIHSAAGAGHQGRAFWSTR